MDIKGKAAAPQDTIVWVLNRKCCWFSLFLLLPHLSLWARYATDFDVQTIKTPKAANVFIFSAITKTSKTNHDSIFWFRSKLPHGWTFAVANTSSLRPKHHGCICQIIFGCICQNYFFRLHDNIPCITLIHIWCTRPIGITSCRDLSILTLCFTNDCLQIEVVFTV